MQTMKALLTFVYTMPSRTFAHTDSLSLCVMLKNLYHTRTDKFQVLLSLMQQMKTRAVNQHTLKHVFNYIKWLCKAAVSVKNYSTRAIYR